MRCLIRCRGQGGRLVSLFVLDRYDVAGSVAEIGRRSVMRRGDDGEARPACFADKGGTRVALKVCDAI